MISTECDGCGSQDVFTSDVLGMKWCEDCYFWVPDDWPETIR